MSALREILSIPDTPETDAEQDASWISHPGNDGNADYKRLMRAYTFARTLERQRNDLLAALERICAIYGENSAKMAPLVGDDPPYTMERAVVIAEGLIAKATGERA